MPDLFDHWMAWLILVQDTTWKSFGACLRCHHSLNEEPHRPLRQPLLLKPYTLVLSDCWGTPLMENQLNLYHRTVRYDDLTAVAQLMQAEEEKERICSIVNQLAQQTRRGSLSAYWQLPLIGSKVKPI